MSVAQGFGDAPAPPVEIVFPAHVGPAVCLLMAAFVILVGLGCVMLVEWLEGPRKGPGKWH